MSLNEVQVCDGQCWGKGHSMCNNLKIIHGMTSHVQKGNKLYEMCWLILPEKGEEVKL